MMELNPADVVSSLPAAGAVVLVLWWRLRRIERAIERLEERERDLGARLVRLETLADRRDPTGPLQVAPP